MDVACKQNINDSLASKLGVKKTSSSDECESVCVAEERHMKEKAEIEAFVKDALSDRRTIETKIKGPGKMVLV